MKREIIAALSIVLFSMTACTKEKSLKSENEMKFTASYSSTPLTKATSLFSFGNKATVYGYPAEADLAGSIPIAGTPIELTAVTNGNLTSVMPLYLPKGSYDFYSVSLNEPISPGITFNSNYSEQLINGKDYLWAKDINIGSGGTASFVYEHKAVGVEVSISTGEGINYIEVTSIKITPAKPDALSKMSLSTGEIGVSSVKDNLTSMVLNSQKGQYIMLPLSGQSLDIEVMANVKIGDITANNKIYTASVPIMNYESGYFYTINLKITSSSMHFSGSIVNDWIEQTLPQITLTEN